MSISETQRNLILDSLPDVDGPARDVLFHSADTLDQSQIPKDERGPIVDFLRRMDQAMVRLALISLSCQQSGRDVVAAEVFSKFSGMWNDIGQLLSEPSLAVLSQLDSFLEFKDIESYLTKFDFTKYEMLSEQLEKLAPFKEQKRRKRRKSDSLPSDEPLTTENSFAPLASMDVSTPEIANPPTVPTIPQPDRVSPIYVKIDNNWNGFLKHLNSTIVETPVKAKLNGELLKIQPNSIPDYRALVNYFRSNNIQFNCLLPRNERPVKILIRGLPVHAPVNEILSELSTLGFEPRSIAHLKNRNAKNKPMPLFVVNLTCTPDWEKIFDVTQLLQMEVEIKKFKFNGIKQCYNCQGYYHSSLTCTLPPKCVKCGEGHPSKECKRDMNTKPTCALCKGPHPANYRGCPQHPLNKVDKDKNKNSDKLKDKLNDPKLPKLPKKNFSWNNRKQSSSNINLSNEEFPPLPTTVKEAENPNTNITPADKSNEKSSSDSAFLLGDILKTIKNIFGSFNLQKIYSLLQGTAQKLNSAQSDIEKLWIGASAIIELVSVFNFN